MDAFLLIKQAYEEEAAFEKEAAPLGTILKGIWNTGKNLFRSSPSVAKELSSTVGGETLGAVTRAGEQAAETSAAAAGAAKKPGLWKNFASLTGLGAAPKGTWGYTMGAPLRPIFGGEGAGSVMGFGILGGTLNAAMADPGNRMEAFAKGFGSGLAGGAGWEWGGKLGKGIIGRLAKPGAEGFRGTLAKVTNPMGGLDTYGKILERGTGQIPSLLAARTAAGTIGLGSALGSSMLLQHAAETNIPFLNPESSVPPGAQAAARAAGGALGIPHLGLTAPQLGPYNMPGGNPYGTAV